MKGALILRSNRADEHRRSVGRPAASRQLTKKPELINTLPLEVVDYCYSNLKATAAENPRRVGWSD